MSYDRGCHTPNRSALRAFIVAAAVLATANVARASVSVVGSLSHEFTVTAAGTYQGSVVVRNNGNEPQEVKVYQTDYMYFADGRSLYGEPGSLPRSNARWITYSPAQLTVPPGEAIPILYTIQVPDDASLRGTYWSVLMVEPISAGSVESAKPENSKITLTIRQVIRYSVNIIADVDSAAVVREVRFSKLNLEEKDGRPVLTVDVENVGERWLIGKLSAELYDSDGDFTGSFAGGQRRLYPGTGARFAVDLSGLDHGKYQALLVLDSGGDDVFGADVTLVLQ